VTTYGDKTKSTAINKAISSEVTWGADHVTRTTIYKFANDLTHTVKEEIKGTAALPTYSGDTQTIVTTYGDKTKSTAINKAIRTEVTRSADNQFRTITYSFANGGTNMVVDNVKGDVQAPVFTPANYPDKWNTTGGFKAPSTGPVETMYVDGLKSIDEDGSRAKPFLQTTLANLPSQVTDPNGIVSSLTTTYDLTWGIPDKKGPDFSSRFKTSNKLETSLSYVGIKVTGPVENGKLSDYPTLKKPSGDILDAWNKGWTGVGRNILIMDSFSKRDQCAKGNENCHGVEVMMITDYIAPGATKMGLDFNDLAGTVFDSNGVNLKTPQKIDVINMSFHYGPENKWTIEPSDEEYKEGIEYTKFGHDKMIKVLNGTIGIDNVTNVSGALITKSAGNFNLPAQYDLTNRALAADPGVASRLLIVGALDGNGTPEKKVEKAWYSNTAGTVPEIASRFVMAYGKLPWTNNSVAINGTNVDEAFGTSFAAPIVAGYAAIIMQKFPNLDAIKTSSIILDTARTDTLACSPDCKSTIYGRGEASLSRALAPVGRLR
jgi:hypothetical protein